ncbi:hypothetical protein SAMN02949497_2343 [Methylomagnum ishizawai]|uniref:Lipoprotein n=1 Tax=Methylomagnum ishizawai TaxID=1760988 RepID=A0A1Y6D2B0_9GAMM|nr:hypothetical protein [Methylomagnum ishizawai]SMF95003.1 hypothetical protein SAMN02949497_2343 [Methylomagnum ishizawai]
MNTLSTLKTALILLLTLGFLAGCAQPNPHPMDMTAAVQSAKTPTDHLALANHYQQAAQDAQAQVEEHKKLLAEYQAKSYLYGKQAATWQAHCQALIYHYQQIVDANRQMADMHRKMAEAAH